MVTARLIADPELLYNSLDAIAADLRETGFGRSLRGLSLPGCEELVATGDTAQVFRTILEAYFPDVDMLVCEGEIGIPALFVSDMDSTMIGQECIDELADFAGLKPQIAAITERAMQGDLDFESALRERVLLLRGLPEGAIAQCLATRISPMPGAATLVATLKAQGCRSVLVTGGFHQFADPVAAQLGFDHVVANRLEIAEGSLTGGLIGPITGSSVKRATLLAEMSKLGVGATSLATGDGANDIPMLQAASCGIAYRAKPKARAAADGWVDQGDLTAVLVLLGISESEWVRG